MKDFIAQVTQAIDSLEAQGEVSQVPDSPRCHYHMVLDSGKELRCIVGWLMPLEVAKIADGDITLLSYDTCPITTNWVSQFSELEIERLQELQNIHDDSEPSFAKKIAIMKAAVELWSCDET